MKAALAAQLQAGYGARLAAGYCWKWSDPRPDQTLVPDVTIGDWQRSGTSKATAPARRTPRSPPRCGPANPPASARSAASTPPKDSSTTGTHVPLGPDLVWRNGGFVSRREHNQDLDFRNTKTVSDLEFDRLVRNVYKVLLTRGTIGTLI